MTQVMSTETTDFKFAAAAAAAAALRAEEPSFAWANEYKQPDKIIARAEQLQQEIDETQPITDADIEDAVNRCKGMGISEGELREVAQQYKGASRSALAEMRKAVEHVAQSAREEANEKNDASNLTPEEKFQAAWEDYKRNQEEVNNALAQAHTAGYVTDKQMEDITKGQEAIDAEAKRILEMAEGEERDLALENLKKMQDEQRRLERKAIEDAIAQAEARGDYKMVAELREALKTEDKMEKSSEEMLNSSKGSNSNESLTNEKLKESKVSQRAALLDDEPEEIVAPDVQNNQANTSALTR